MNLKMKLNQSIKQLVLKSILTLAGLSVMGLVSANDGIPCPTQYDKPEHYTQNCYVSPTNQHTPILGPNIPQNQDGSQGAPYRISIHNISDKTIFGKPIPPSTCKICVVNGGKVLARGGTEDFTTTDCGESTFTDTVTIPVGVSDFQLKMTFTNSNTGNAAWTCQTFSMGIIDDKGTKCKIDDDGTGMWGPNGNVDIYCPDTFPGSTITNNLKGLYDVLSSGTVKYPKLQPILCINVNGATRAPIQVKQGDSHDIASLDITGIDIRTEGCKPGTDPYYGTIVWYDKSYNPPVPPVKQNGKIITTYPNTMLVENYKINKQTGSVTGNIKIQKQTATLLKNKAAPVTDNWYTGINLSGLEFSTTLQGSNIPTLNQLAVINQSKTGDNDWVTLNKFVAPVGTDQKYRGANTIRIPIRWAYMQPQGSAAKDFNSEIFSDYFDKLVVPMLATLTGQGYYVILDLHSYMHYSQVGTQVAGCSNGEGEKQYCPQGTLVYDHAPYVAIWTQIQATISQYQNINQSQLMYDIVNEPSSTQLNGKVINPQALTPKMVFDMETAVIAALAKPPEGTQPFGGKYLVEGYTFSGLHSWKAAGNTDQFTRKNFNDAGITDKIINNQVIINVHQYLDKDFSGTNNDCLDTTGKSRNISDTDFYLQDFLDYLETNQFKAMITEFGVGPDLASCQPILNQFLQWMKKNAYTPTNKYGFVGWTAWSTGHAWSGQKGYNLYIAPPGGLAPDGSPSPAAWKGQLLANCFDKGNPKCGTAGPTPPPGPTPPTPTPSGGITFDNQSKVKTTTISVDGIAIASGTKKTMTLKDGPYNVVVKKASKTATCSLTVSNGKAPPGWRGCQSFGDIKVYGSCGDKGLYCSFGNYSAQN